MLIRIHEFALNEYIEAIEWYEQQSKDLGRKFKKTILDTITRIKNNQKGFLIESEHIYKAYVPGFPYKILFSIEYKETIVIWAFAHLHRRPLYWRDRLS